MCGGLVASPVAKGVCLPQMWWGAGELVVEPESDEVFAMRSPDVADIRDDVSWVQTAFEDPVSVDLPDCGRERRDEQLCVETSALHQPQDSPIVEPETEG